MAKQYRIYIDSEFRDSGTNQNFQYSLKRPFEVEPNSLGFVSDVCIPNVFESIIPNYNDRLYVRTYQDDWMGTLAQQDYTVQLTRGQYDITTIATELQTKLNATQANLGITVTAQGARLQFATTLVYPQRIELLTKEVLQMKSVPGDPWNGNAAIDFERPNDACNTCGINEGTSSGAAAQSASVLDVAMFHSGADYRGSVVQLVPYKLLFLHSNIGDGLSYGAQGESSIVRRIPIVGTCGDMIHDSLSTEIDMISLPPVLSTFWFALRDKHGRDVDLLGHSMQLSLIVKE